MAKRVVKKMQDNEKLNFSLISYVLGIVALVQAFISPVAGIAFAIIGLIFSKKEKNQTTKKSFILNLIALIAGIIFLAIVMVVSFFFQGNYPISN